MTKENCFKGGNWYRSIFSKHDKNRGGKKPRSG